MFALGVVVLLLLSLVALVAAAAVVHRVGYDSRSERAAATGLLWNAIIIVPIYGLGSVQLLTAMTLGITSAIFSVLVFATAAFGRPFGSVLRQVLGNLAEGALLPFTAVREAWRARSLVLLGLLAAAALIGWTALTAYYSPSWRQWDALWYHEPIIGFTIQNRGFSVLELPNSGLQKTNGYPSLCEMTQLWFVIFTDRRLVEIANSVLAPLFMVLVYLLAKRHTKDRIVCMGWAAALLIMPASSILLASVYVDLHTALLVLGAVHFGTRAELRLRDVLLTALCLAMAIGAKVLALAPVGILSLIVLSRTLWAHVRRRPLPTLGTLLAGIAMMGAFLCWTYLRNWKNFHNPFWPDLVYDNPKWGIHWPGQAGGVEDGPRFDVTIDNLTSPPYSRTMGHATQIYEYGFISGWFFFPLAAVCTAALIIGVLRAPIGRLFRLRSWRLRPNTLAALYVAIVLAGSLYLAPTAFWGARYYIVQAALAASVIAWACGRPGFERLHEGAVGAITVGMVIAFFWTTPRWWYWPSELATLARIPYPAREFTPSSKISPALSLNTGSAIPLETGLARERELGPGSILAFSDNDGVYAGLFWNNRYSNKVVYVPSGPDFLARVEAMGATWVYCSHSDPMYPVLRARGSHWSEVGPFNVEHWGSFFRRVH